MKWDLSLPEPSMLVYYFAKFVGLAPFTVNNERFYPPTLMGKLYTAFVAAAHLITSILTNVPVLSTVWLQNLLEFSIVMATIEIFTSCATTFITIMIFLVMYNKILYIMNKLSDIGNELKILGIEENLDSFFNTTLAITVLANVAVVLTCVLINLLKADWPMSFMISYNMNTWFHANTMLIFVEILSLIEKRFKLVNEKLDEVVATAGNFRSLHRVRIFEVRRNPRQDVFYTNEDRVRIIEDLHIELCDLIDRSTNLFAIPILLKSFQICASLILCCYFIYFKIRNSRYVMSAANFINISRSLVTIFLLIAHLFFIARASAKTCKEGNSTKAVISKARYEFKPQELEDELYLFSLQLLHKPVTVSILGFFNLEYSYVYEMLCTVVAYIVILIQFDSSQPNPDT